MVGDLWANYSPQGGAASGSLASVSVNVNGVSSDAGVSSHIGGGWANYSPQGGGASGSLASASVNVNGVSSHAGVSSHIGGVSPDQGRTKELGSSVFAADACPFAGGATSAFCSRGGAGANQNHTMYAPGVFPRAGPKAPPIFATGGAGRRTPDCIQLDIRLRATSSSKELLDVIRESLPRFDTGNVVIAFCTAAKTDEGQDMGSLEPSPAWFALQERLVRCAPTLEPRGMSMTAYAAAKLQWGDEQLFTALAQIAIARAADFGSTDIAKACWAFAKLRYVTEPLMVDFWTALECEAHRTVRGGRFVDMSMTAWALASTGYGTDHFFKAMSATVCAEVESLPPRSLSGTAWAFAKAGKRDAVLFAALSQRAQAIVRDFGTHDAAAFCWSCATVGEVDVPLFDVIASTIVDSGQLRKLSPPLAAELAWAYAAARVPHKQLFEEIEHIVISKGSELESEDAANFAWSFVTAGIPALDALNTLLLYSERYAGRLRSAELRMLLWAFTESRVCGKDRIQNIKVAASSCSELHPKICP